MDAGSKHQPRRPAEAAGAEAAGAEAEEEEEEAPDASVVKARLIQLDEALSKEQTDYNTDREHLDSLRTGRFASFLPQMEKKLLSRPSSCWVRLAKCCSCKCLLSQL